MVEVEKVVTEFEALYTQLVDTRARLDAAEQELLEHRRILDRKAYRVLGFLLRRLGR